MKRPPSDGFYPFFWAKVRKTGVGDNPFCWAWTANRTGNGYGMYRQRMAHRVAYEALVERIPTGLELDHLCRNRSCVNPAHLEPVTHQENMRRSPLWGGRYQRAKTHCKAGHPYDETNTYPVKGGRDCRACRWDAHLRRKARRVSAQEGRAA